jgi:hypothetical protein
VTRSKEDLECDTEQALGIVPCSLNVSHTGQCECVL